MKARRITTALMSVCLLAGSIPVPAAVAANDSPLYGDVNCDAEIDVRDAVLLARNVGGDTTAVLDETARVNADVNGNNKTDAADLTELLRYLAKLIPQLNPEQYQRSYKTVDLMEGITGKVQEPVELSNEFLMSQFNLSAELLQQAMKVNETGDNVLLSPTSIALALGMTANGAKGQTLSEMEQVLGGGIGIDDLNRYNYSFINQLLNQNTEKTALYPANSIWVVNQPNRIKVPQSFLQTVADFYAADAYTAPFNHDTAEDINNWVSDKTHEMIDGIFDLEKPEPIPENAAMYLINALAFEAEWSIPYYIEDVNMDVFHPADDDGEYVEMMSSEEYIYIHSDKATGFVKPYLDNKYSFAAVLPNKDIAINDYVGSLDGKELASLMQSKTDDTVFARLPKFEFSYDIKLNDALCEMGMPTAFDALEADFSGLNEAPVEKFIGEVLHKTYIAVDERGTRAGAVTSVMIADKAIMEPKYVYLDRPFMFMIIDNETGLPVFLGVCMHPTEARPEPAE